MDGQHVKARPALFAPELFAQQVFLGRGGKGQPDGESLENAFGLPQLLVHRQRRQRIGVLTGPPPILPRQIPRTPGDENAGRADRRRQRQQQQPENKDGKADGSQAAAPARGSLFGKGTHLHNSPGSLTA